jgi:hypothetical protein
MLQRDFLNAKEALEYFMAADDPDGSGHILEYPVSKKDKSYLNPFYCGRMRDTERLMDKDDLDD